jgi:hypothetical protein
MELANDGPARLLGVLAKIESAFGLKPWCGIVGQSVVMRIPPDVDVPVVLSIAALVSEACHGYVKVQRAGGPDGYAYITGRII